MTPDQALREQPDNFTIEHGDMRKVVLWQKTPPSQKGQILKTVFWEVEFESSRGKEKYTIDMLDPEQALTAGYGS